MRHTSSVVVKIEIIQKSISVDFVHISLEAGLEAKVKICNIHTLNLILAQLKTN